MRYGHFDDQQREYVITQPNTPLPWINYLGCEAYFGTHLQHRRRLLLLPRRAPAPADALSLQQRAVRCRRALPLPPRQRHRQVLVAVLAADAHQAGQIRMPPRHGLYHHRFELQQDRSANLLLRAAGRDAGNLEILGDQPPQKSRPGFRFFPASSSVSGTRRTTPPISSATSAPARSRSWTASSITRPSIASAAIISRISPARKNSPASTRNATRSSALIAVGTTRRRWSAANPSTPSRTAGRRTVRTTSK